LVIAGVVVAAAFVLNKKENNAVIKSQGISDDALKQLANSDVTVGEPKQVLNVQSSAIFAGKVLIKDGLQVAGQLQVGSNVVLPNIAVSGTSILGTVQVNNSLSVAKDTALQGNATVKGNLSVAGTTTFSGNISAPQVTTNSLTINGTLNLTHHISFGGATPSHSRGTALGSGGTASVNGSDTAGSINVNTGGSPAAGCFISISFNQRFNGTPRVLVTPVGSAAGSLQYHVNRSSTGFSVCTANTPQSGASFGFDYFVID
jgi:cytoskeletal protein CcmA (bactofilin family)